MPLDFDFVESALLVWEAAVGNGRSIVTADLVGIWVAIMEDEAVTQDEFDRVRVKVLKKARFGLPKPVDFIDILEDVRRADRESRRPRLVMARDREGNELPRPVPIDRVDAFGRLIVPGLPSLPPPTKALPAPMTPESTREQLRGMSAIGRRAFVGLIRFDGGDAAEEIAMVRAIEAEEAAAAKEAANRKEADHAVRVRDQARRMREAKDE